jgi:hypothetical protein
LPANNKVTSGIVRYEVSCSPRGFNITYQNGSGNTEQQNIYSSSWTTSFTGETGDFVYISAQADSEGATVTTKIYFNGVLIEHATSSGDFVIANSSGSVP